MLARHPARARGGGDRRAGRPARGSASSPSSSATRRRRSSTPTASRRRSRASSARASTVSSSRCPKSASGKILRRVLATSRRRDEGERVSEYDGFRVERDDDARRRDDHARRARASSTASRWPRATSSRAVFAELDATTSVRFVVLTGAGGAFTAGGDIAGFLDALAVGGLAARAERRRARALLEAGDRRARRATSSASGSSSRSRATSGSRREDVQLALPEATIGMIPGSGGTQRLARLVGLGRAKDIVMRGRRVGAEEALALGLVTRGRAAGRARRRGRPRSSRSSRATRRSRSRWRSACSTRPTTARCTRASSSKGLAYGLLQQTHDFREGVEAFARSGTPEFDGT